MVLWDNKKRLRNLLLIVFVASLYFPVFLHLEKLPMRIWDESRLAINALEMSRNGNHIVTYYEGSPDNWNTKPPLMIWLQTALIKTMGFRELSVRLPSAIAAFVTFLLLLWFSRYYLKRFLPGVLFCLVLATTNAYLNYHVARTGDYDALLTLFVAAMCLMIFLYSETGLRKFLVLFFVFLTLGVYTKSIQALLMIPGIVLYLAWQRKLLPLLKNRIFWIGTMLSSITIVSYYLIRDHYDPYYIEFVFMNEVGGRYLVPQEGHLQPFTYYFEQLMTYRMTHWWLLFPCGILAGLCASNERLRKLSGFAFLMAIPYLLIISNSQTKLAWYDAPAFPFLAIGCGIVIYLIFLTLSDIHKHYKRFSYNILPYLFLIILFANPCIQLVQRNYMPKENWWEADFYNFSYYLKDVLKGKVQTPANAICYDGHKAHLAFYVEMLKEKGIELEFKDYKKLSKGDVVVTDQQQIRDYIRSHYANTESWVRKDVSLYEIK